MAGGGGGVGGWVGLDCWIGSGSEGKFGGGGASYLSTFSSRVVLVQFHGCRSTVALLLFV